MFHCQILFLISSFTYALAYDIFPKTATLFNGDKTFLSVYSAGGVMVGSTPNTIHFYRWDGSDWVKNMDPITTTQYHYPQFPFTNGDINTVTSFGGEGAALDTMSVWHFTKGAWTECSYKIPQAASNIFAPEHQNSHASLFDLSSSGAVAVYGIPTANGGKGAVQIYKYTSATCKFELQSTLTPEATANGAFGSNIMIDGEFMFIRGNKKVYIYTIINNVVSNEPVYIVDPTKFLPVKPAYDIGSSMMFQTPHLTLSGNNYYIMCTKGASESAWTCVAHDPSTTVSDEFNQFGNEFALYAEKYYKEGTKSLLKTTSVSAIKKADGHLVMLTFDDQDYKDHPLAKELPFEDVDFCSSAVDGAFAITLVCQSATKPNPVISYENYQFSPVPVTPTAAPTAAPTPAPTAGPTEGPTAPPSTPAPTSPHPTDAPTAAPTDAPTQTLAPTAAPTEKPSSAQMLLMSVFSLCAIAIAFMI